MARYVRIDEGPGVGTFLLVAIVLLLIVGPYALIAIALFGIIQIVRRIRQGGVTPAVLFGWVVGPLALAGLLALLR